MRIRNKYKFIRGIAILLFVLIGVFNISIAKTDNKEAEIISYTIEKGDTLWNIAKEHTINKKEIRQVIYEIKKLNNMKNSNIYENQIIKIKKGQ